MNGNPEIVALRAAVRERDTQINLLLKEIHYLSEGQRELQRQNEQLRTELTEARRHVNKAVEL